MKYQKIIGTLLTLGLTTFATAGGFSIAAVTNIQTIIIGSSHTGSNADDAADFLPVVAEAIIDNSDDQRYGNPDSHYQRYVGLGFDLSASNGYPHSGDCNGNGHENNSNSYCGEPSPSD